MSGLSVVICTRDRASLLADLLSSLAGQDRAPRHLEIVVVDDGSTDTTGDVVHEAAGALDLRYVRQAPRGLSAARNAGAAAARHGVVAYLDDDTLVEPGWSRAVVDAFEHTGCDGMAGRIRLLMEAPEPRWLTTGMRSFLSELDLGDEPTLIGGDILPFGANCAVRRDALLAAGGFRTDLGRTGASLASGEDVDLFRRVHSGGGRIVYWPAAAVRHRIPGERLKPAWFVRRAWAAGLTDVLLERPTRQRQALARETIRIGRALPILAKGMATGTGAVSARLWLSYCRGRWHGIRRDGSTRHLPDEQTAPEVAVVIPTRNRLPLLRDAVASVRQQAGARWELVVVDDASEDGTAAWLATLGDARLRVVVLEQHSERSAARNAGLAACRAPYVLFLDDDDRLRPGALARLRDALVAVPDAAAAAGAAVAFNADGHQRRLPHPRRRLRRDVLADAMFGWVSVPGATLLRTAALAEVGGWREGIAQGEDQDLALRLATVGPTVLLPSAVLDHRRHAAQRRPADTEAIERRVRATFVAELHGEQARTAQRALSAREDFKAALAAWERNDQLGALRAATRAARHSPALLASPLVGQRVRSVWARAAVGAVVGPRMTAAAQRTTWAARTWAGRAPDGPAPLLPPRRAGAGR